MDSQGKKGFQAALLYLDCRSQLASGARSTSLVQMHPLLVDHDSEYHYLFKIVHDAKSTGNSEHLFFFPNATRRMLGIFTKFCSPGQHQFAGALLEHASEISSKVEIKALERLIQTQSHGGIDATEAPSEMAVEEAIKSSIAAIGFMEQVAPKHTAKMKTACRCA